MKLNNILKTERLYLNEITGEDLDFVVKLRSNENIYKFFKLPHRITADECCNWYNKSYVKDINRIDFIARLSSSNIPVGVFGIINKGNNMVEINYMLSNDNTGNGYAKEAIDMLMSFARDSEWKSNKACAIIHKNNSQSIDFIVKNGFTLLSINNNFLTYVKTLVK